MISVIMSTHNEPLYMISDAIDSILRQSYTELELIIVDDNPERVELKEMIEHKERSDSRVKIILNSQNIGLAKSLNKAIIASNGDYIARMDADDYAEPDRLEKELKHLEKNKLDLVGCNIANIDVDGKKKGLPTIYPRGEQNIKKYLRYNSPMAHPTWLGKASLFKENMYIDYPACEDYEFLARIVLRGKRIDNIDGVLLRYRLNARGISNTKRFLQKTCLSYVRRNYRRGIVSNYDDCLTYLNSSKGKRRMNLMKWYYTDARIIKKSISEKHYYKTMSLGVRLLFNPVTYENFYYFLRCNQLKGRSRSDS